MPAPITQGAMGTRDLLDSLSFRHFNEAKQQRRSLSALLEQLSPTDKEDRAQGLDAFGRLMREVDVVTRSVPEAGVYADEFGKLHDLPQGRLLTVEYCRRQWERGKRVNRAAYRSLSGARALESADLAPGSAAYPYADDVTIRMDEFQPAIPIAEVLAAERGINTNVFRGVYLTEPAAGQKRMVRVGERAEIPKVSITVGQRDITLYKFGRGIELTYEVMRREPIDRIGTMVQLMAIQAEVDKLAAIISVLMNGDGNAGTTPTSYNLTTLDSAAAAGTLSFKGWTAFRGQFQNPYVMTTALAQAAMALQVKLLNAGSANLPVGTYPTINSGVVPINNYVSGAIRLGETVDAPANKIVGIDRRMAIERIYEIGGDISETERYASNQTQTLYMTDVEGYMIVKPAAVKVLVVNA